MSDTPKFYYEADSHMSEKELRRLTLDLLATSQDEIDTILKRHGVTQNVETIANTVRANPPNWTLEGSGSVGEVVAISVSLVPVINAIRPLLKPFADKGAKLAFVIGTDLWKMLKSKMLEKNVRLRDKGSQRHR